MKNNIILNKSLDEYNKKYGKKRNKLKKWSKKEVEAFDLKHKTKNYLLKHKKWWLIEETFYEVPKFPKNLNAGAKVASAILLVGMLGGAGVGIYTILKNMKPGEVEPTKYNVTYDAGAGLIDGQSKKTVKQGETIEVAPNATRNNYLLDGWGLKPNESDKVVFPYKITGDTTFYARWNDSTYYNTVTVYFEDGNEKSEVAPLYIRKGSCLKDYGTLSIPSKKNYKFINWYYDKECSKGQEVNLSKPIEDSIKLYAKYEKEAFQITFSTVGSQPEGSRKVDENLYVIDSVKSLNFEPYTKKDGAAFLGWNDKTGNKIKYPFKPSDDSTVLVADFKDGEPSFDVNFVDKDGTTISTATGVAQISTPPDAPVIPGLKFTGWKDTETHEMIVFPESGGYQLTKNCEFQAQYEICIFKVELYKQITEEGTPELAETREGCSKISSDPGIIVDNHKISRWYKYDGSEKKEVSFPLEITEDTKLYGVYLQSSFSVEFYDVNETKNESKLITKIANASKVNESDLPQLSKKNHSLTWMMNDPEKGAVIPEFPIEIYRYVKSGESLKFFTNWVQDRYDLTLVYPEGIHDNVVLSNQKTLLMSSLKEHEHPKDDKLCIGWSYDSPTKEKQEIITEEKIELKQNTTLYAVYETRIFDVTVSYVNKEKEEISSSYTTKFDYGTHGVDKLTKNDEITYKQKNYKFTYWSDDIAGTNQITEFKVMSNRTVYAIYSLTHSITLKYKKDGAFTSWSQTISDISSITYNEAVSRIPAEEGYVLTGKWYYQIEKTGGPEVHEIVDKVNPFIIDEDNLTIFFEYKIDSFTATFYMDDGVTPNKTITGLKNGDKIYKNQIPDPSSTKGGSIFNCWKKVNSSTHEPEGNPIDFENGYLVNTTTDFGFIPVYDQITKATFKISDDDYKAGKAFFAIGGPGGTKYQSITVDNQVIIDEHSFENPSIQANLFVESGIEEGWLLEDGTKAIFPYKDTVTRTFTLLIGQTSKCTVCLDSGDGHFSTTGDKYKIMTVVSDISIKDLKGLEGYKEPTYDSHTFVCWQIYDDSKKEYIDVNDDYIISSNIYLHAKFIETIKPTGGTEKDFTTNDNWATIVYYANQGETVFLKTYKFLNNKLDDLVGKTRSITLNDGTESANSYSVVVCGVNHDDISKTNNVKGLMTFSLLNTPYSKIFNPSSYTGKSNNWNGCKARKELNLGGSVYSTIDPIVVKYSKTVNKITRLGQDDTSKYNTSDLSEDKFFLFSGTELGMTNTKSKDYVSNLNVDKLLEGKAYKYFEGALASKLKMKLNGKETTYWIRSPYNNKYAESWGWDGVLGSGTNWVNVSGALNVKDSGSTNESYFGDVVRAYIFGFVIGVQNA